MTDLCMKATIEFVKLGLKEAMTVRRNRDKKLNHNNKGKQNRVVNSRLILIFIHQFTLNKESLKNSQQKQLNLKSLSKILLNMKTKNSINSIQSKIKIILNKQIIKFQKINNFMRKLAQLLRSGSHNMINYWKLYCKSICSNFLKFSLVLI